MPIGRPLSVLSAAALLPLLGLATVGSHPAIAQGTPAIRTDPTSLAGHCTFTRNLYSIRRSLLRECGFRFIERSAIVKLPGGGKSYIYNLDGHKVTYNIPPRGFNLLTATSRQLQEYNIPARKHLGGRQHWDKVMSRVRWTAPPPVLIEGPTKFAIPACGGPGTPCWAGYVDVGHSNYTTASADFVEPHISSSSCPGPLAEGTWVGIGGFGNASLGQDGTSYGVDGNPHGAWWEVLPAGPIYSNWTASPGDTITATATWDGSSSKFQLTVVDGSHILNPAEQSGSYNGSSADFITEDPSGNYLENFGSIPFSSAQAWVGGIGTGNGVGHYTHDKIIMTDVNNGNQEMAQPTSITGSFNDQFTINQNACK